jgi:hypothetical protein
MSRYTCTSRTQKNHFDSCTHARTASAFQAQTHKHETYLTSRPNKMHATPTHIRVQANIDLADDHEFLASIYKDGE